ncbi:MAG: arginine--tRNA ligase [Candidatus Jorgensenbacteria bacterium]
MREKIIAFLKNLKKLIPAGTPVSVSVSEDERFGHYSTNLAFTLTKLEGYGDPMEKAGQLAEELRRKCEGVARAEACTPGFVNIWLKPEALQSVVSEVLRRGAEFGAPRRDPAKEEKLLEGEKIQVEFVSANPTGPLTLANGRGGFLGDVLANVLTFAGAGGVDKKKKGVEREYYVNDTGNQIRILGKSILVAVGLIPSDEDFYQGEYVKKWARTHKALAKKYVQAPEKLGAAAARDFLKSIKQALVKKARIRFDRFTSEKGIHIKKFPSAALAVFKKKGVVYEKDGAVWLKTSAYGDDKDRVLITSDGEPTYFLADAGHYLETKKRGFTAKINILGPDHYGYKARIQAAAKLLGLKRSEVIITQALHLVRGGKEVRMSKRRGEFVTLEDMVDEVGIDAARFFSVGVSPDTHIDFDLEFAKERSMKNPVFYAQYAYVRARGILEKLRAENLKLKTLNGKALVPLSTPEDVRLILKFDQFSEFVENVAKNYQVHQLTWYAMSLARAFHNFYERERVIGEAPEIARARTALVNATEIVLKNLFSLLGISAPDRM